MRLIVRDAYERIDQILEQEVPATAHDVALFLRRAPFKDAIAQAMLNGGTVAIERKAAK